MLASARGVAIKVKQTIPVGNMVVFTAAQGDETAYPYKEEEHGLFTYYLLKKLQENLATILRNKLNANRLLPMENYSHLLLWRLLQLVMNGKTGH